MVGRRAVVGSWRWRQTKSTLIWVVLARQTSSSRLPDTQGAGNAVVYAVCDTTVTRQMTYHSHRPRRQAQGAGRAAGAARGPLALRGRTFLRIKAWNLSIRIY